MPTCITSVFIRKIVQKNHLYGYYIHRGDFYINNLCLSAGAMDNIESQLEYFEKYEMAVAELSQLGFDNNVLSNLDPEQAVKFYQELNEMDTATAKGKVDEINEKMGKLSEVKDKASETMLGLNEELTQKFADMQKDMETAVNEMITDMDRNSEAGEAAVK